MKFVRREIQSVSRILLIAPEGIEIAKPLLAVEKIVLLIAPEGIEMVQKDECNLIKKKLLIAPEGIEICQNLSWSKAPVFS